MWHTSQWDAKKQVRCWNVWGCMVLIHVVVGLYYWEICLFGFEFSGHQGSEEGNNTDLVNQWWLSCSAMALDWSGKNQELWVTTKFSLLLYSCIFVGNLACERMQPNKQHQSPGESIPLQTSSSDWYNFWDNGPCYSSWYLIWKEHNFKWDEYLIIWKNNSMDHHINWPNRKPTDHSCGENVFGMFCTSYIYNII